MFFFFFKQKTAYEIKECDWSSDVCSSDLQPVTPPKGVKARIDARLFAEAAKPSGGLWGSLMFWRGLAFASVTAAVAFGIDAIGRAACRESV